jgi:hypothetical protein
MASRPIGQTKPMMTENLRRPLVIIKYIAVAVAFTVITIPNTTAAVETEKATTPQKPAYQTINGIRYRDYSRQTVSTSGTMTINSLILIDPPRCVP